MNVFIVDDASFVRLLCRHHVEKYGHKIIGEAYDGKLALEQISSLQPDCVIMDLALPSMNGVEIMKKLNADYPQIQFIVVSALDKNFCDLQLEEVSFTSFITKPFESIQIKEALYAVQQKMEKLKHG